ncbi:MAG TPA: type II secretion system protein GspL [Gammaproteobacteria bacterium]|nr:type II secretion system protein GspL [Gammaproteobacteria bacterium]
MRNRLFIRLGSTVPQTDADKPATVSWLALAGSGEPLGAVHSGTLQEAAAAGVGYQIVVLVPGSAVLLTRAAVPSTNRQRIARALPFALEEQLASDVEQLHFAIGRRQADQQISAAVVGRTDMDAWLAALQQAGIHADWLVPETLAVPRAADSWSVLVFDADTGTDASAAPAQTALALVSTDEQAGFATDADNLELMLTSTLANAAEHKPAGIHLINCSASASGIVPDSVAREFDIAVTADTRNDHPLMILAKGFDEENAINLLQGDYSRREQLGKLWRPWRAAAALLLIWLVLQGGMMWREISQLSRESQQLQQQIQRVYMQAFPDARNVVNPRVQMQQRLDSLRAGQGQGGKGFLELLARSGGPLKDTPNLDLRNVSYKEGQLNLDLSIKDLQALDQLKQRLTGQAALSVEIQSATSQEDKVQSRLQIQAKKL